MSEPNNWAQLQETFQLYAIWALSSIFDTLFLTVWVACQWLVATYVVSPLRLTGMDSLVLTVFQILFSVSTLSPVVMTTYRDMRLGWLRTQRQIRHEMDKGDMNESD